MPNLRGHLQLMKRTKFIFFAIFFLAIVFAFGIGLVSAQTNNNQTGQSKESENENVSNETRISALEVQLKEIRRDQLNYQIEKDLLKETYSTNLQSINTTLTIVLGLFSIIGFLGINNIQTIKKEYLSELEKLRQTTADFQRRAKDLQQKQDAIDMHAASHSPKTIWNGFALVQKVRNFFNVLNVLQP
jgi:hypothetical protein